MKKVRVKIGHDLHMGGTIWTSGVEMVLSDADAEWYRNDLDVIEDVPDTTVIPETGSVAVEEKPVEVKVEAKAESKAAKSFIHKSKK